MTPLSGPQTQARSDDELHATSHPTGIAAGAVRSPAESSPACAPGWLFLLKDLLFSEAPDIVTWKCP